MKLTLVIPSLRCGGAERVMSILANYWAEQGESLTLITLDSATKDFYSLDGRVQRFALDLLRESKGPIDALKNNAIRLQKIRYAIVASRPDAVISFMNKMNVLTLLATRGLPVPVIVEEHTDPRQQSMGRIWEHLRLRLYPRADAVVVLTERLREWGNGWLEYSRLHVIPNPVISAATLQEATPSFELPENFVVAVGRLSPEKGFDMLLEAYARADPQWALVILGEGPERSLLQELIAKLDLSGRVFLPGATRAVGAVLGRASMFVMSSRREGFPMALIEAMNCGLTALCFDCPTGPGDIIRDGEDGVLVPAGDIDGLAEQMSRLMKDPAKRTILGARAKVAIQRFSVERISGEWERLIDRLALGVERASE